MKKEEYLNTEFINSQGLKFKVLNYHSYDNIDIIFEDGFVLKHRDGHNVRQGCHIVHPMYPTKYGVGYMGIGPYVSVEDKKTVKAYAVWADMIRRCYDKSYLKTRPTYQGCTVCEEWKNYQNFAKWHKENYYEFDGDRIALDKDIIKKGNKIYSPNTCVYVPNRINSLILKSDGNRGKLPIGVRQYGNSYYAVQCGHIPKHIRGACKTPEEAFLKYKEVKEQEIKNVANQYKDKIPQKLYDALMRYEVEITD